MVWYDDFLQQFNAAFKQSLIDNSINDLYIYYRDGLWSDTWDLGDKYINLVDSDIKESQPQNEIWMSVKFIHGSTQFSTIGLKSDQLKREPFSFHVIVHSPSDQSKKKAYNIINLLDKIMLSWSDTNQPDFCLRISQSNPKFMPPTTNSINSDIWNDTEVNYRFVVEYC